jgi:hypothetical protein
MYNGSTILLCVTIFVVHKQCLIRAHCSIVTVPSTLKKYMHKKLEYYTTTLALECG